MRSRSLLATFLIPLALGACTTTLRIPPSELSHLDGFDAHDEYEVPIATTTYVGGGRSPRIPVTSVSPLIQSRFRLISEDGTPLTFTSQTMLTLVPKNAAVEPIIHRYRELKVNATELRGVPLEPPLDPIVLPIDEIDHASVRTFDVGATFGLLAGILGAAIAGSTVALVVVTAK